MTISAVVPDIAFAGSSGAGTMGPFSLIKNGTPLVFFNNSEVVVLRYDSVTDTTPTLLVEGTDYTLTGGPTAGSITLTSPQTGLLTAERLYVTTVSALAQSLDLVNGGNFSSSNLERRLDVIFQILQQHAREIKSTIRFAMFDTDEIPKTTPLAAVIDKVPYVTGTASAPTVAYLDALVLNDLSELGDTNLANIAIVAADLASADTIGIVAAAIADVEDVSNSIADVNTTADWINAGQFGSAPVTATGSVTARTLATRFAEIYNVKDWGAVGNGSTNDRAAIQAAIDAAATAGGGVVFLPAGTYSVGASGSTAGGQDYSLFLKDKVHLRGAGMFRTTIKAANSSDCDIITTVESGRKSLMAVTDLTIDGNETNQSNDTDFGFGIWAYRIDNLFLDNVRTTSMCKFGFRIEDCDGVVFGSLMCDHPADDNADGMHFIDTKRVVGGSVLSKSLGDDAFIITAKDKNVSDYNIGQLVVESVAGQLNGMRGLLISQSDAATAARTLSNIKVNVVAKGCYGNAVDIRSGTFQNLDISVTSDDCARALYIQPGTASYAGSMRNCRFTVLDQNSADDPVLVLQTYGDVTDCQINARINNPDDGENAVLLRGDRWSGSIDVEYDPAGTKASPQAVVVLSDVNDSRLAISVRDGTDGLTLNENSSGNTILLGAILECTNSSITITSGSVNNTFVGGRATGSLVNNGGLTNRFVGVRGMPDDSLRIVATNAQTASVTGTTSETSLRSETIPGGTLRTNGVLRLRAHGSFNDATDNKTLRLKFGATTVFTQVYTAGTVWMCDLQLSNINSASSQRWFGAFNRTTDTLMSLTGTTSSENTANDLVLELTGQLANSADTINVLGWTVEVAGR